jgi:hypothetical protein
MASKVKFVTPFGVASYPHLNAPDTKGKYADNKYKTKLVLRGDDPDTQAFVKRVDAALEELKGSKKASFHRPYTVDDETGEVTITAKSKYAPAIFDAKNQKARKVKIGRGSTIRLMGELVPFEKGITAQLHQVQIKELNGWGESAFDAVEDGYEYDPEDAADDEAASGNDSGSDQDDGDEESSAALDI